MLAGEIVAAGGSDTFVTHRFGNCDGLSLFETRKYLRILRRGGCWKYSTEKLNIASGLLESPTRRVGQEQKPR
ncbi:hypothetical protein SZ00_05932 [Rhodococcus sp. AD45]|nr:hypothetical protein SZ00_05932 [Rhodococcus sp. AD45]